MTVELLNKILEIKAELKSALVSKSLEPSDNFSEYPELIMSLGDPFARFFRKVENEYITEEENGYENTYQKYQYVYDDYIFVKGELVSSVAVSDEILIENFMALPKASYGNDTLVLSPKETVLFNTYNYLPVMATAKGYDVVLDDGRKFDKDSLWVSVYEPKSLTWMWYLSSNKTAVITDENGIGLKTKQSGASRTTFLRLLQDTTANKANVKVLAFNMDDTGLQSIQYVNAPDLEEFYVFGNTLYEVYLMGCTGLKIFHFPDDISQFTYYSTYSFQNCTSLSELRNINGQFQAMTHNYADCPLNYDSLTALKNALPDTQGKTYNLNLSSYSYSLLTQEDIALITNLGYTIKS